MRVCDRCYKKLEREGKNFTIVFMETFNQDGCSKKKEEFELCDECYHETRSFFESCEECYHKIRSFFDLTYTMTPIDNQEDQNNE